MSMGNLRMQSPFLIPSRADNMLSQTDFLNWQEQLHSAISVAVIRQLPSQWAEAWLDISLSRKDVTSQSLRIGISGPDGNGSDIQPPDEIFEDAQRLFVLFSRHGEHLRSVTY